MVLTNVFGAALTIRATHATRSNETKGHLLLTGSVAGRRALPGSLYSVTKRAVTAMGEAARLEFNGTGVRVTLIEPGMVDTPFFDNPPKIGALDGRRHRPRGPVRRAAAAARGRQRDPDQADGAAVCSLAHQQAQRRASAQPIGGVASSPNSSTSRPDAAAGEHLRAARARGAARARRVGARRRPCVDVEGAAARRRPASPGSRPSGYASRCAHHAHVGRERGGRCARRVRSVSPSSPTADTDHARRVERVGGELGDALDAAARRQRAAIPVEPAEHLVEQAGRRAPRGRACAATAAGSGVPATGAAAGAHAVAAAPLRLVLGDVGGAQQLRRPPVRGSAVRADAPRDRHADPGLPAARRRRAPRAPPPRPASRPA